MRRCRSCSFATKCLTRSADAFALQAAHERGADDAAQQRIFRVRLEVAAGERIALDVDVRAEHDVHAERARLAADRRGGARDRAPDSTSPPSRRRWETQSQRRRASSARRSVRRRSASPECRDAAARSSRNCRRRRPAPPSLSSSGAPADRRRDARAQRRNSCTAAACAPCAVAAASSSWTMRVCMDVRALLRKQ